jgi:hypothetical protein
LSHKLLFDDHAQIEESDAVLIIGTTLEVYSVFRLVRAAFRAGIPLAIINQGETRIEREAPKLIKTDIAKGSSVVVSSTSTTSDNKDLVLSDTELAEVERQIEGIIQFKTNKDCNHILSELAAYYQNI